MAGGGGGGTIIITRTADKQMWLDSLNTPRSMCDYAITAHLLHQLLYKWRRLCTVVWQTLPRGCAAALKVKYSRNIFALGIHVEAVEPSENTWTESQTTEFENWSTAEEEGMWTQRWKQQPIRGGFPLNQRALMNSLIKMCFSRLLCLSYSVKSNYLHHDMMSRWNAAALK